MCKGLLGKKLGMTALFSSTGEHIPVTVIHAGPCVVTQIKTKTTEGYDALQLGLEEKKEPPNKPMSGHLRKSGGKSFAYLREFRADNPENYTPGQTLTAAELFEVGERVHVKGPIKGRGFSGVIRRHGFHGGRKTHGSKSHRIPGSVGCSAWPSRIVKGKKMPGHYGNTNKTVQNLEIIDIRPEENLIMVRGPVPGSDSGLVAVYKKN